MKTKALTPLTNAVLPMPNGLALSNDESILYVANSNSSYLSPQSVRDVYAFGFQGGTVLSNPRLIYQAEAGWPDGIRVSKNGYLFVAVANGADIVDPNTGLLLGKVHTPDDIIYNLEPASSQPGVWLLTGGKKIYKVIIAEPGKDGSLADGLASTARAYGQTIFGYVGDLQQRFGDLAAQFSS
jgi:gluconolactonase